MSESLSPLPLVLPAGSFRAFLFDLDGTIADSMPIHFRAWTQAVTEFGGTFPEELFYALGGVPLLRTVEILNERFGTTMPPEATVHRKEALYLEKIEEVQAVAAVADLIAAEYGRLPFAVVSGSPRSSIFRTLTTLGLLDRFEVIVGSEDYARGKPNPEPFLTAAAQLKVPPESCLVFEDADAGIQSAEAAGMAWVRIPQRSVR